VTNTQDTLLFDLNAATMTHLVYVSHMAVLSRNTAAVYQQAMAKAGGKGMQPAISVTNIGPETVDGYACTHYQITTQMGYATTKRDMWVTSSLGIPGVQVAGGYLYYTVDFPDGIKLRAEGGTGVVVKSQVTGPGLHTVMDLVAVDTNVPAASQFVVPSWYTIVDHTNY
jgi:hypothetical protein